MAPALTAKDILDLWERGLTKPPIQRSLDLLGIVYPDFSLEQLCELPIGQRDLRLLAVREALFGPRLHSLTSCPQCGERLEMTFDIAQLRAIPLDSASDEHYSIALDDYEVEFRLPNSGDMLRVAELSEDGEARQALFESCVKQARRAGVPISASELPEELVLAAAARMAELDPQADMQIALTCPACSSQWSTTFDIVSYLWIEINAWALRLLHEIHRLASAYGWREADILSLSPMRRRFYLELIG
jgi:hypothetical protein